MATLGKRRALGQHFLRNRATAETIAATALELSEKHGCKALLEIGPGKGAITLPLLEKIGHFPSLQNFILCERDRELAAEWRANPAAQKVQVREADFVQLPEDQWLTKTPLGVVSNLPYSAGTAILVRLAEKHREIPVMVLMFQAEVAQRVRAEPGTKSWGSLSLWIQNYWDVKKLLFVPPSAFSPPPKVNSEVVVLMARETPLIEIPNTPEAKDLWEKLLKTSFLHRRKMLRSGLPPSGPWRNALEQAGLDGTKRAEALSWNEWQRFYQAALRLFTA